MIKIRGSATQREKPPPPAAGTLIKAKIIGDGKEIIDKIEMEILRKSIQLEKITCMHLDICLSMLSKEASSFHSWTILRKEPLTGIICPIGALIWAQFGPNRGNYCAAGRKMSVGGLFSPFKSQVMKLEGGGFCFIMVFQMVVMVCSQYILPLILHPTTLSKPRRAAVGALIILLSKVFSKGILFKLENFGRKVHPQGARGMAEMGPRGAATLHYWNG